VSRGAVSYDDDLYAWTKEQADLLRQRAANEIDWDNLAEEIEAVGRSERREIRSRLEILLIHLLKWRYQPEWRSNSWRASISEARRRIEDVLADNPSLSVFPGESLAGAYRLATFSETIRRLELYRLPDICPWTIHQVLDPDFWP
jgi:Domain of unknown function DUF29